MRLLWDVNWWMPGWTRAVLRIRKPEPAPQLASQTA